MVTKRKSKKVAKWQYLGEQDPAVFIHSNKTHSTASEAFKDATYATAFWRCETEWDRTKKYLGGFFMWAFVLFSLYALAMWFNTVAP